MKHVKELHDGMNQKKNKVDKVIAHGSENVDLKYDM